MAQKTDAELTTEANVIGTETIAAANTADRVGDMLINIIDSKVNNDDGTPTSGLPAASTPLDGTELVALVQVGVDVQATAQDIADLGGGGGGHVIEDEGTPLTQRADLNFVGAGVTVTDAGGKTVVTIPSGAVADGDKGDITVSSSGTVWTIDNDVVTDAKLAAAVKPIGVQDLWVPASYFVPRVTNGCSVLTQTEMTTSLFNIMTLDFDQTTQEFAQCQVVLPRKWDNGTITVVPYWTAIAGSGTVQWGISGGAYSNDDALTVAFGSAQTSDDTLIAVNDLHIGPETSAITLAGTPADADFLAIQISRNPASDTLTGDAKLLGISIRITTDAAKDN